MRRLSLSDLFAAHRGEAAALATAVCWSVTPFFFTAASRRIGAFRANLVRLVLACLFLGATAAASGAFSAIPSRQVVLLAASGLVGLTLGDAALFEALVILGPRRVSLLSATAPLFLAVLSVPLLAEGLSLLAFAGMELTLVGVAWVILERTEETEVHGSRARGILMGVLAAAGQAGGALLVKAAMGDAPPNSALGALAAGGAGATSVTPRLGTLVRMIAGCGGMLVYAAATGRLGHAADGLADRRAIAFAAGGAVFGPFVGVWLSLFAFKHTSQVAVAQTIMAFSPVLVLAIGRVVHGERASARAWFGTLVALVGVAVLAFRNDLEGVTR